MILEDKRVMLRLRDEPEFALRLDELLTRRSDAGEPALVIQARPEKGQKVELDLSDSALVTRFGNGCARRQAWWDGFQSMVRPQPTFHGLASLPARTDPAWATEMHGDGHFIACLWSFPELPGQGGASVRTLADFHSEMFSSFFELVADTLATAKITCTYQATATVVSATKLHFASKGDFGGSHRIAAPPLSIENLQWPIATAQVGTASWLGLATRMGRALAGAYGV